MRRKTKKKRRKTDEKQRQREREKQEWQEEQEHSKKKEAVDKRRETEVEKPRHTKKKETRGVDLGHKFLNEVFGAHVRGAVQLFVVGMRASKYGGHQRSQFLSREISVRNINL